MPTKCYICNSDGKTGDSELINCEACGGDKLFYTQKEVDTLVEAEREECLRICHKEARNYPSDGIKNVIYKCCKAIRSRSK